MECTLVIYQSVESYHAQALVPIIATKPPSLSNLSRVTDCDC